MRRPSGLASGPCFRFLLTRWSLSLSFAIAVRRQGRRSRRCRRYRPASLVAHEAEPARLGALVVRCRQHARCCCRLEPHQLACPPRGFLCYSDRYISPRLFYLHVCYFQVKGFKGAEQLEEAVAGVDLVLIPAGLPRKPGMTRDDLFNKNASIVQGLAEACAK